MASLVRGRPFNSSDFLSAPLPARGRPRALPPPAVPCSSRQGAWHLLLRFSRFVRVRSRRPREVGSWHLRPPWSPRGLIGRRWAPAGAPQPHGRLAPSPCRAAVPAPSRCSSCIGPARSTRRCTRHHTAVTSTSRSAGSRLLQRCTGGIVRCPFYRVGSYHASVHTAHITQRYALTATGRERARALVKKSIVHPCTRLRLVSCVPGRRRRARAKGRRRAARREI